MKKQAYLILWAVGLLVGLSLLSGCATTGPSMNPPPQTGSSLTVEPVTPTVKPSADLTTPLSGGAQEISGAAVQLLAQEQNASPADVRVVSVEPVNWRDACLGIKKAGMMCAQVITPGYRITLELDGR